MSLAVKHLDKHEADAQQDIWEQWVIQSFENGASRAFRFSKAPRDTELTFAADEERQQSTDVRVLVEADTAKLSETWGSSTAANRGEAGKLTGFHLPEALTVGDIVGAAAEFRTSTSAVDGLHPRQVGCLCRPLLECSRPFQVLRGTALHELGD